eukprot:GHVU01139924.1.p1 GENE.GHVU01139924.1~~GHVU01139924.1.p1  ORF type:complete len:315 (-),score=19.03 GHVU01139924.1:13-957(-)
MIAVNGSQTGEGSRSSKGERLPLCNTTFNETPEELSPFAFILSHVSSMVGTGLLAMPGFFKCFGLVFGVIVLIGLGAINWLSAVALMNVVKTTKQSRYDTLGGETLSRVMKFMLAELPLVFLLGLAATVYEKIAVDTTGTVISKITDNDMSFFVVSPIPSTIAIGIVSFLLASGRSYKAMEKLTSLAPFMYVIVVVAIVTQSLMTTPPEVVESQPADFLTALGRITAMSMCYFCHCNVPGLYAELLRREKPRANLLSFAAFGTSSAIYAFVGIIPFLTFKGATEDDIVMQLASSTSGFNLASIAQILLGFPHSA